MTFPSLKLYIDRDSTRHPEVYDFIMFLLQDYKNAEVWITDDDHKRDPVRITRLERSIYYQVNNEFPVKAIDPESDSDESDDSVDADIARDFDRIDPPRLVPTESSFPRSRYPPS